MDGMAATDTPRRAGYYMPAEWEPHEATWIAWPHNRDDWPGKFGPIPWVFAEIVRHLHTTERVRILVQNGDVERSAILRLRRAGVRLDRIEFSCVPTDRVWVRDSGPIFLRNAAGDVALTNWGFNAWAKYNNWQRDNAITDTLARAFGFRQWKPCREGRPVVLEGGSIDVNGHGTLLTTEECLLSSVQQRNPGVDRRAIEDVFAEYLGARKVLWLKNGIVGDDTHGHVDDLARFVNPTTVVTVVEDDPREANYAALKENLSLLRGMTDQDGRPLRVVPLPMPAPLYFRGQRLPASYANFYIANGVVLVPTFNDERDRLTLTRLAELFPDRRVIGIHAVDLVWGLGTIHCMTQQQPKKGVGNRE